MITMPPKDPGETLDYTLDWSQALEGDSILASIWSVDSGGVAVESSSVAGSMTTVYLSGGTTNVPAVVKNTVTAATGRVFVSRLKIPVLNQ